ncbi:MAG: hypothetical protein K9G26_04725 [Emcibacter sp.]|nr:hypothetical protein [Emcibacter sp.]
MTTTYRPGQPIWCSGCGHYGVQGALKYALTALNISACDTMILSGIGCSGTMQNNLGTYGYHTMHGRVLPTATGTALANPDLTVIAAGGDGDGYAIGAGHFVHALKRNPSLVYIVMNNGTYGLTKGQDSPTKNGPKWAPAEEGFDAMMLGLSIASSSFLARGFSGDPKQLNSLMVKALEHARSGKGLALLEVMSPCVTYNDTYPEWDAMTRDVKTQDSYDSNDKATAFATCIRMKQSGQIPTGIIYQGEHPTLESAMVNPKLNKMSKLVKNNSGCQGELDAILNGYRI